MAVSSVDAHRCQAAQAPTEPSSASKQDRQQTLVMVGVDFRSASVAVRGKISLADQQLTAALQRITRHPAIHEALFLSTCNRTELYAVVDSGTDWQPLLGELFIGHCDANLAEIWDSLCWAADADAARHLFRVTAGLESMVLGEAEIVSQLKQAIALAKAEGTLGTILHRLADHALAASKRARTEAGYAQCGLSVVSIAIAACRRMFPNLSARSVLLIGAGATAELALQYLIKRGVRNVVVANRTVANAARLAKLVDGAAVGLDAVPAHLDAADMVISCTSSPQPVVTREMLAPVMAARPDRAMLIADLAVPRDVEPEVASIPGVKLLDIDSLEGSTAELAQRHEAQLAEAEEIIDGEVEEFAKWFSSRRAVAIIAGLQQVIEDIRMDTTETLAEALGLDGEACLQIIDRYTKNLVRATLRESLGAMKQFTGADDASHQMDTAYRVLDNYVRKSQ